MSRRLLFLLLFGCLLGILGGMWEVPDGSGGASGGGYPTRLCNIAIEQPSLTDDIMCGKAYTDYTLVSLTCNPTGATNAVALVMTLFECASGGDTCTTGTNLTVTVSTKNTEVTDSDASGAVIDEGNWFRLDTVSFTTSPDRVECQVEFTVAG